MYILYIYMVSWSSPNSQGLFRLAMSQITIPLGDSPMAMAQKLQRRDSENWSFPTSRFGI